MREVGRRGYDTIKRQRPGNRSDPEKRRPRILEFYSETKKGKTGKVTFLLVFCFNSQHLILLFLLLVADIKTSSFGLGMSYSEWK